MNVRIIAGNNRGTKIQNSRELFYSLCVYSGFVKFRDRWYDPEIGKWLSRDPIGVMGGVNLYGYVGNNGVNKVDIFGLDDCTAETKKINCINKCNATIGTIDMLSMGAGKIARAKDFSVEIQMMIDQGEEITTTGLCNKICSNTQLLAYKEWYNCEGGFDKMIDRWIDNLDNSLQNEREAK